MKALITGASSGLGREFAKVLSHKGYDLILVARRKEKLLELKNTLSTNIRVISLDLSMYENCIRLYEQVKNETIDILINNAGFGLLGEFCNTNLKKELEMINININAPHILTKLFLIKFIKRDAGYILNVSSSASFFAGPLMATYYATKNYVTRLSSAIEEELRRKKSHVYIGVLCPGPIDTNFHQVANVKQSPKGLDAGRVARYACRKMFQKKHIIIPDLASRFGYLSSKIIPNRFLLKITYLIQKKKEGSKMKKTGFTLIELLASLVVLAIISGIIVSNVYNTTKQKKEEITTYQEKMIKDAAEAYMADYIDQNHLDCTDTNVLVSKLVEDGYLSNEYKNFENVNVMIHCLKQSDNTIYTYELNK